MKPFAILLGLFVGCAVARADDLRFDLPPLASAESKPDAAEAQSLFDAAVKLADEHSASGAYQDTYRSLKADTDFEPARKLLGYVRHKDQWHSPFAIRQLFASKVYSEKFGWLPADHLARYERGERFYRGRWMPDDQEAKLRANIEQGWRVESEHYRIQTNDSLETGVVLARKLERLHCVWSQLFAGYMIDDAELVRRFEGKPPRSRGIKQHEVVYFRNKEEYVAALRQQQPKIDMTLGIYFDTDHTAYFYAGESQDAGTLWHEATHQLFSESRPTVRSIGRAHSFWAVEGVACYMESFTFDQEQNCVTLGALDAGRLPAARERLLVDNFYVPLAELTAMGMEDLQSDARIAKIYSQSAGLATFFLQAEGGKYREAFVAYLKAIYDGGADQNTLATLTGRSYAELDEEYRQWMKASL